MSVVTPKPTALVLGSTGQVGQLVVRELENSQDINVRLSSRRKDDVERWRSEGKDAVHLDLDDPRTFGVALAGLERLFLLTGYSAAMLVQRQTLVGGAKKAGAKHIVHLGGVAEWDSTHSYF